jgi:zinc transporter, ZIP family
MTAESFPLLSPSYAFLWGILSASSLLIGAVVALKFRIPRRAIGLIMAFGAGALISALSFDLIEEAVLRSTGHGAAAFGIFAGCLVFFGGDWLIGRWGGSERKDSGGAQESGTGLAIVLGSILDGIPESMVIGLTLLENGKIGASFLVAVVVSNLPEAISATTGLALGGWKASRILAMWLAVVLVLGLASFAGYALFQHASSDTVAFVLAFAAGAILTMLADTMMPEAFEHGGILVGVFTTFGFGVAFLVRTLA